MEDLKRATDDRDKWLGKSVPAAHRDDDDDDDNDDDDIVRIRLAKKKNTQKISI